MDLKTLAETPPWDWPQDTRGKLLRALTDERTEPADRLIAADLAGDYTVVDDEVAEALLAILDRDDAPEDLRATAAHAFGVALEHEYMRDPEDAVDFGDDDELVSEGVVSRIQRSLHRIATDEAAPQDLRRRCLEASVRLPEEWHPEAVRAAYRSDDPAWRLTAVYSMTHIRGFEEEILEALDSGDTDVRYHAVTAAGNWEMDAAWPHVAEIIGSEAPDKDLLLAAFEAACMIRPEQAPEILVELTTSDDEDVVEAAFEAIAMAEGLSGMDEDLLDEEEEEDED